jgi:hypothetical protein
MASGHPLRALVRELEAHAQGRGLPLRFLTPPEVTQYLAARFAPPEPQAAGLEAWGRFIHQHTDGNPLFMVLESAKFFCNHLILLNFFMMHWKPRKTIKSKT